MGMIFVKPLGDQVVADPATGKVVPREGDLVADSEFWRRRIYDGDFELSAPPASASKRARD